MLRDYKVKANNSPSNSKSLGNFSLSSSKEETSSGKEMDLINIANGD